MMLLFPRWLAAAAFLAVAVAPAARAQDPAPAPGGSDWVSLTPNDGRSPIRASTRSPAAKEEATKLSFRSRQDSVEWAGARRVAVAAEGFRVVVSVLDRRLWVIDEYGDTLRAADVAVATDEALEYNGRRWTFKTPRGRRVVRFKEADPVWTPPDWHYAEVARDYKLKMRNIPMRGSLKLKDGSRLSVRDSLVGITRPGKEWEALPVEYEVVFDSVLYVPPVGTKNRRIEGQLGKFKLDMGDGYMLHGTPYQFTVGTAVTHGCVRLRDDDIEWLYDHVPVGTKVYIY